MRTKWLSACVAVLFAVAVAVTLSAAGSAPKEPDKAKATPPVSCSESAKIQSAKSDKPQPEPGTLCLVDICKVDSGVLYHCTVHVCNKCCRYDTSLDCTPDPNCSYNVPPYCQSSENCPPNTCKDTCGAHTCGHEHCN